MSLRRLAAGAIGLGVLISVAVISTVRPGGEQSLSLRQVQETTNVFRNSALNSQHPGDDIRMLKDCECKSICNGKIDPSLGEATCVVAQEDCMGVDYKKAIKLDPKKPCIDPITKEPNKNCVASCEFVEGRYDCWNFPCLNGAYCLDGVDSYTCYCTEGYDGQNCQNDINECVLTDPSYCDHNAACHNYEGGYGCDCKLGWYGDGYQANETAVPLPGYAKAELKGKPRKAAGCLDVDDCASRPCFNGATCTDKGNQKFECTCAQGWVGPQCKTDIDECENGRNNCAPNSHCTNTPGSFQCECDEFFTGDAREGPKPDEEALYGGCADIDDCIKKPCENGGTCFNLPMGKFDCQCVKGWTHDTCGQDLDECDDKDTNECSKHAECINNPGSYECSCLAGWTGNGVECVDANDCVGKPCKNGGKCIDCGTLCFVCDCVLGWRGKRCETDWNECIMGIHTCHNDARCINTPGSYTCECDPGFSGDGWHFCVDVDDCVKYLPGEDPKTYEDDIIQVDSTGKYVSPCGVFDKEQNNFYKHGACRNDGADVFVCDCDEGWGDHTCDLDINECALHTHACDRRAACTNTEGSYKCACRPGYTGNGFSCHDIDDCTGTPCKNGVCTDVGTKHFKCMCFPGWTDKNCDFDVNECGAGTHTCHPDATCTNTVGSYDCACNSGFEGNGVTECHDFNDCASAPCKMGKCTDHGDSAYMCTCESGWMDSNCDHDINECYMGTHDCNKEMAKCVNTPGSFMCRCFGGFKGDGRTCVDIDDCDPDPCDPAHGTCSDLGQHRYTCSCEDGYGGDACDEDLDECALGSHSCSPQAHCLNTFGSYICECFENHFGDGQMCTLCTTCNEGWMETKECAATDRVCTDENECELRRDRCHEAAQCINTQGSYTCECHNDPLVPNSKLWTGDGFNCDLCKECEPGYRETRACTSTLDRKCELSVKEGLYYVTTTAGGSSECLVMGITPEDLFPYRYNWGYGDPRQFCGVGDWNGETPKQNLMKAGIAVWKFEQIRDDLYKVSNNAKGKGYSCLSFTSGEIPYPELHRWGRPGDPNCGITQEGVSSVDALLGDKSAVWRIVPLEKEGHKVLLQTNTRKRGWECLGFSHHGTATNPSRIEFGNEYEGSDDRYCHISNNPLADPKQQLLVNQQAVFELHWLGPINSDKTTSETELQQAEARNEARMEMAMPKNEKGEKNTRRQK